MEIHIPLFIQQIVEKHVKLLFSLDKHAAFMPGGQNGPYFDVETPVRNTAHWLISFSIYYYFTENAQYRSAAQRLLTFLLNPKMYERDGVYVHRQKTGKDWSNGVIGQAWVGEALFIAGSVLRNTEAIEKAKSCLNRFKFDKQIKAWYRIDAADGKQAIDYTLNHQLWHAAAKAEAIGEPCFREIDAFLSQLNNDAFKIRKGGLINHLYHSSSIKGRLLGLRYKLMEKRNPEAVKLKELGYHLFNMYPLARLFRISPDHPFFISDKFTTALKYTTSDQFLEQLPANKYAYQYNSPAFEMPLVLSMFRDKIKCNSNDVIKFLLSIQENVTYDKTGIVLTNAADSTTLTARVYEYLLGLFLQNQRPNVET